jgi:hypothetical protein
MQMQQRELGCGGRSSYGPIPVFLLLFSLVILLTNFTQIKS